MAKKAKVDYDEENDVLWVYSGGKVKDSLEIDNFVIDFSSDDGVVGVEIFNASEMISNFVSDKISKEVLSKVKSARLSFYQSKELVYVIAKLLLPRNDGMKEVPMQFPAPREAIA